MIQVRKGIKNDIPDILKIYDAILTLEENKVTSIGWIRGVYPTEKTLLTALSLDDLYVMTDKGQIVAAARINKEQPESYKQAHWKLDVPESLVSVLHTLTVDPACKGKGYGTKFVEFYAQDARDSGCRSLRMDTNATNKTARRLYEYLGFDEVGIVRCEFNGIENIDLVCLERVL